MRCIAMTQIYIGNKCNEIDTCIPQPFVLQDKIKLKINFDTSYDLTVKIIIIVKT